jgi:cyclophilin family peptidyl-prolyl cis-trans isomerase
VPKATKRERQRQNREVRRQAIADAEKRRKRWRAARNLAIPLVIVAVVLVVISITSGGDDDDSSVSSSASTVRCVDREPTNPPKNETFDAPPPMTIDPNAQYAAVLHTSCGDVRIELDAKQAPQTVNSFLFLVQNEFYSGTTFHRIVTDFVDQGGDPTGTGSGGPGYTLPDEPPADGYKEGDVAMANSGPNTSGSQFFLVVSKNGAEQLNSGGPPYKYSILGHMDADGLRVAKKINTFGSADSAGTPTRTIYTFDVGFIPPQGENATTTTTAPASTEPTATTLAP